MANPRSYDYELARKKCILTKKRNTYYASIDVKRENNYETEYEGEFIKERFTTYDPLVLQDDNLVLFLPIIIDNEYAEIHEEAYGVKYDHEIVYERLTFTIKDIKLREKIANAMFKVISEGNNGEERNLFHTEILNKELD